MTAWFLSCATLSVWQRRLPRDDLLIGRQKWRFVSCFLYYSCLLGQPFKERFLSAFENLSALSWVSQGGLVSRLRVQRYGNFFICARVSSTFLLPFWQIIDQHQEPRARSFLLYIGPEHPSKIMVKLTLVRLYNVSRSICISHGKEQKERSEGIKNPVNGQKNRKNMR